MSSCCSKCAEGQEPCCEANPSEPAALAAATAPVPCFVLRGSDPAPRGTISTSEMELLTAEYLTGTLRPERVRPGVPKPLTTRLAIRNAETTASLALDLGECTGGSVDVVVFAMSQLDRIEASLEVGTDLQNYNRVSTTLLTQAGATRIRFRNLVFRMLRIYFTASGSQSGIGVIATTVYGVGRN